MRRTTVLFLAASILLVPVTGGWGADTFKCGARLVRTGDTKLDVLNRCGEPTFREYVGTETRGFVSRERRDSEGEPDRRIGRGRFGEFTVDVEQWYYDCGRNKLIRILTFKGGVLRRIEVGRDYGVGGSDCVGPAGGRTVTEPEEETGSNLGTISILGTPYGARIYLDHEYIGDVPATLEGIEPGAYNMTVSSRGYQDWVKRIVVEPNRTVVVNVYLDTREEGTEQNVPDREETVSDPPAPLYKWTDEEGNIHITDKPPPTME